MINLMTIMYNEFMPSALITPRLFILDDIICLASCSISLFVWFDGHRNHSFQCLRCHRIHGLGLYLSNHWELEIVVNFNDFRAGLAEGWEEYSGDDEFDDEMQLSVEADWAAFIKFRTWQISHFGNEWLALHRVYF